VHSALCSSFKQSANIYKQTFFSSSGSEGNVSFEQVIKHLEQSCRHLESLADPLIDELTEYDAVC